MQGPWIQGEACNLVELGEGGVGADRDPAAHEDIRACHSHRGAGGTMLVCSLPQGDDSHDTDRVPLEQDAGEPVTEEVVVAATFVRLWVNPWEQVKDAGVVEK